MQENLLSSPFLYGITLTLVHFLWQGVIVALVLKALLMCTPSKSAQLRYGYSLVAMVVNFLLPIITFSLIYRPDYHLLTELRLDAQKVASGVNNTTHTSEYFAYDWLSYFPSIALVWFTVVAALVAKLLIELYSVNKLTKQSVIAADETLNARFHLLAKKLSMAKTPALIISLQADVPMAIGWLKPVVLLPMSMLSGLTPMQLDMLLLHELAHIRRHDYLVNFMQTVVEILLFFHPCVKWVSKQMRNEREYCSDDIAVHHCGDAMAYAHTLADTASLCKKHQTHSIPTMAMAASGGDLKQRVVRLVDEHHCASSNEVSKWFASVAIIGFLMALAVQSKLSLPYIDLSSGKISLNIENKTPINQPQQTTKAVKENTLAAKLLAQESTQPEVAVNEQPMRISTAKSEKQPIVVTTVEPVNKTNTTLATVSEEVIRPQPEKTADIKAVSKPIKPQTFIKADAISQHEEKSMAALAFERTDSRLEQSLMANPYADNISTLTNEPANSDIAKQLSMPISDALTSNVTTIDSSNTNNANTIIEQLNSEKNNQTIVIKKSQPKLLYSVEPRYPASAKRKGIELEVLVHFTIDVNGHVTNIQFPSKSRVNYFRSTIRNAIEKWRFEPAKQNGVAVTSNMSKIFSFSLIK